MNAENIVIATAKERNLQIRYVRAPDGWVGPENFELTHGDVPVPGDGEVLVRNHYLSLDPYQRRQMIPGVEYVRPLRLGAIMEGRTVGEVLQSQHRDFRTGDFVYGDFGWQQFGVLRGEEIRKIDTTLAPPSAWLGVLGSPGITAWVGLLHVAKARAGETVIVSAAAGAVGSVVGQIARLSGCRVVGIAGGPQKCRLVVEELGFHACVDYRAADFEAMLAQATPDGADVDFENVGGTVFDTVLTRMNDFGRIALCGLVSQYNLREPQGLRNVATLLNRNLMLQGFRVGHYKEQREPALHQLADWVRQGKLRFRETVAQGLEKAPQAFVDMLAGHNVGKQVVKLV